MNRKYLLRGIGIGLIIGCLVTYTAFKTGDYTKNNKAEQVTENKASNEATTEEKTTVVTTEEKTTEEKTTVVTTEEKTTEEITTEKATEKPTEKPTEKATEPLTTEEATTVSITVSSGMGSEQVCSMLYDAGLITDEYSYNLYLENNGYADRIRVGTFTFTKGMSEEEIANALISQGF